MSTHLSTDRLLLRGLEARDFEAYAAMVVEPEVMRYLAHGGPLSSADA